MNPVGPRACYDEGKRVAETLAYSYNKQSGTMIMYRMAKLNLLSHPNVTLAPQLRQAKASIENLNYMTLAPQARPRNFELLAESQV